MFKVPDWEDTPKNNISFTNDPPPKKIKQESKKTKTPEPKQVVQAKPMFKAKAKANSKLKLINGGQKTITNINLQKLKPSNTQNQQKLNLKNEEKNSNDLERNRKNSDYGINIKNYNSDKLDEMILDVKKQRLDSYKNDDNEEILFNEGLKKVIEIKKNTTTSIQTTKNVTDNTSTKSIAKPKQELISPEEDNEKQKICKDKEIKGSNSSEMENGIINKQIRKTDFKNLHKKAVLKSILQKTHESTRIHIKVSGNKLRERMLDRLKAAKFRFLNEKLYTSSGSDAQQLFQADPSAFQTYHEGYQQQVSKWPVKPLDVIVKRINKMRKTYVLADMGCGQAELAKRVAQSVRSFGEPFINYPSFLRPKTYVIADMGCGQAELAKRVAQSVRSFDLVAAAAGVEACDMARTPLLSASVDVAVYCLALMGTELTQYLIEANRVLKLGGHLLIAEVESRFDHIDTFTSNVQRLGFSLKKLDDTQQVFFFLEFTKVRDPPAKKGKLPTLTLKPCIYKKR